MYKRHLVIFLLAIVMTIVTGMFTGIGFAAPAGVDLDVVTPIATWNLDSWSGACGTDGGLIAIQDASSSGGSDAYDYAWGFSVDGSFFSTDGTVDLTGTTVTEGPTPMSGLNTTLQYFFATQNSVARILLSFSNPTGSSITTTVYVPNNFGSDSSTTIEGTSSGDTVFTTADRWAVTSDTGPSDPVNTTVFYGPMASVIPSTVTQTVHDCAGTQGLGATFDITVPPGVTRSLLFFAGLGDMTGNNTVAGALTNVTMFDDFATIPDELTSDLTVDQILNWSSSPPPPPPTSIPTMSEWGMIIFSMLLGSVAIWYIRKTAHGGSMA